MKIRIADVSFHLRDCHTRLPFRFGINTMTAAPLCLARAVIEMPNGDRAEGYSSDLLVPRWFEKNPDQPIADDWRHLRDSADAAARIALDHDATATVFEHWHRLTDAHLESVPATAADRLVRGEGVALIERALIDAVCRATNGPLHDALRSGVLGFTPDAIDPTLAGWDHAASLGTPVSSMHLRHTVGLVDAIRASDVTQRVADGLPESLEEDIAAYGLTHFKLKVCGDIEADLDRLEQIATVLREAGVDRPRFTLDGNEQFTSVDGLIELLSQMEAKPGTMAMLRDVMYIEQPLHRRHTYDVAATRGLGELNLPVIIDEADYGLDALPHARSLGYAGISVKNCKGVFPALINAGRCAMSDGALFQSAEDLTNLPVVALHQDLATSATIGLTHIERNGHHYFDGLTHLPDADQAEAIAAHPDLYDADRRLRVVDGRIDLSSVLGAPGYGYAGAIDVDDWTPADAWSPDAVLP